MTKIEKIKTVRAVALQDIRRYLIPLGNVARLMEMLDTKESVKLNRELGVNRLNYGRNKK